MTELKPKHERFCQEYVIDYHGTNAAVRAGYEEKSARKQASRLLTNADILARIREIQQEQIKRLAISQDYGVLQLIDTYNCCREPKPVMKYDYAEQSWVESGMYQFDSRGALKALELLGKALGLFEGAAAQQEHNNLLEALVLATGKEVDLDDIPEIQQAAETGYQLVESAEMEEF